MATRDALVSPNLPIVVFVSVSSSLLRSFALQDHFVVELIREKPLVEQELELTQPTRNLLFGELEL